MKYNSKLSVYKLKKVTKYSCIDIDAARAVPSLELNRSTINHWFGSFDKKSTNTKIIRNTYYTAKLNQMKAILEQNDNKAFTVSQNIKVTCL